MYDIQIQIPERPVLVNVGVTEDPRGAIHAIVRTLELVIGAKRLAGAVFHATSSNPNEAMITMVYSKAGLSEEPPIA